MATLEGRAQVREEPTLQPENGGSDDGLRIGVLVSGQGRGTNLQAILDGCAEGAIGGAVVIVLGTRSDAPAMDRARATGVDAVAVSPKKYEHDESYGEALLRPLRRRGVQLLCLAGYMRVLPPAVVREFQGRIMNVHPALLPLFGGRGMYGEHVHQAVLDSGMKVSGCTVHFVDEEYDRGPIILQKPVMVEEEDTPATLAARVLPVEHQTYVEAIQLFAQGRLSIDGRRVRIAPEGKRTAP